MLAFMSDPPITKKVSSCPLSGQSIPVSGSAFWPVGKPEILHSCSGCNDGPCSLLGPADPPLLRHLAPEDPASEGLQFTNPPSSALNTCLALIPSVEKSELAPTQEFLFISAHYRGCG